jgi:putative tricarboxylic transport membrane protein
VVFLAVSLYVIWEALRLNYYDQLGPGAGFFPFWLGLALSLLSLGWLSQTWRGLEENAEANFFPDRQGVIRVATIVAALVLFVFLLHPLGFRLTMLAFLLFMLVVLGRQNLVVTGVVAVVGSFGVYYAFHNWLGVPLPAAGMDVLRGLGL